MEHLREHLVSEGLAPLSVKHYVGATRRAKHWFDGRGWDLDDATAVQVAAFLAAQPRSWASRNLNRAALGHYWRFVGRADPPLRALRVPPKPRMVCRALDVGDARILSKAARTHGGREGLALALGLYLGLRREEIATLRWADFDGGWVTVVGKGEARRTLPVTPVVLGLLGAHERTGEYLFVGRYGGHVCPATVWSWVRLLADDAGLGRVATHILRHTALAEANDGTGDLRSTQEWAGHVDPVVTAGYTRTTEIRLTAIMDAIDYDD